MQAQFYLNFPVRKNELETLILATSDYDELNKELIKTYDDLDTEIGEEWNYARLNLEYINKIILICIQHELNDIFYKFVDYKRLITEEYNKRRNPKPIKPQQ
jgi:hypothetical protein